MYKDEGEEQARIDEVRNGSRVEPLAPIGRSLARVEDATEALAADEGDAARAELRALWAIVSGCTQAQRTVETMRKHPPGPLVRAVVRAGGAPVDVALVIAVADEPVGRTRLIELGDGSVIMMNEDGPRALGRSGG